MADVVIKLNYEGVGELLKNDMIPVLEEVAAQVATAAGAEYSTYVGQSRANVSVVADTDEAIQDNLDNNTLLKALGSVSE